MSLEQDKKLDFEKKAQEALKKKDYSSAFWNTGKAAEFGLRLAKKSEGKLAKAYLDDANELISIAEELKAKIPAGSKKKSMYSDSDDETSTNGEESEFQLANKPDIKLKDVIGLEEVKTVIDEKVIMPKLHPEAYEAFDLEGGASILLYGPPGNGKTYIAKAIAGELDAVFFPVDMSQIKDKYVGGTEGNIDRLFKDVNQANRAVLFLDEMDSYLSKRGNGKNLVVNSFLTRLDGFLENDQEMLLVLGATNRPWAIDEAVMRPGRFDQSIYVGLPDKEARAGIVKLNVDHLPMSDDVNYEAIADTTEGFSGADMTLVCNKVKQAAVRRRIRDKDEVIVQDDFVKSIESTKPSVSKETVQKLLDWSNS